MSPPSARQLTLPLVWLLAKTSPKVQHLIAPLRGHRTSCRTFAPPPQNHPFASHHLNLSALVRLRSFTSTKLPSIQAWPPADGQNGGIRRSLVRHKRPFEVQIVQKSGGTSLDAGVDKDLVQHIIQPRIRLPAPLSREVEQTPRLAAQYVQDGLSLQVTPWHLSRSRSGRGWTLGWTRTLSTPASSPASARTRRSPAKWSKPHLWRHNTCRPAGRRALGSDGLSLQVTPWHLSKSRSGRGWTLGWTRTLSTPASSPASARTYLPQGPFSGRVTA